jgi:hypothetical protein
MLYRNLSWSPDRGFMWDFDCAQRADAMIEQHPAIEHTQCPKHYYINEETEVRDVIGWVLCGSATMTKADCYYLGNVIKYVLRCTRKDQSEGDLRKAMHYIQMLLGEV